MRARAVVVVVAGVLAALPALADETTTTHEECAAAFEKAQYLRKDDKLAGAKQQALVCAREECPGFVRDECTRILSGIESAQPTIVIAARDASGADLADVRVEVDGKPLVDRLNGQALAVDPGEHTLRYTHGSLPPVEQHLVIRVAEKNRLVDVRFAAGTAKPTATPAAPSSTPAGRARGPLWPAILASGVSVAAVAAAVGTGIDAKSTADALRSTCAPRCVHGDVSAVNTELIVSDVLLGVGVVAAAVATWLFIARPGGHEGHPTATVGFGPTPDGAAGSLRVDF